MNPMKLFLRAATAAVTSAQKAETEKAKAKAEAEKAKANAKNPVGLFAVVRTGADELAFLGTFEVLRRPLVMAGPLTGPSVVEGKTFPMWTPWRPWADLLHAGVETALAKANRLRESTTPAKGRGDITQGTPRGDAIHAAMGYFEGVTLGLSQAASIAEWAEAAGTDPVSGKPLPPEEMAAAFEEARKDLFAEVLATGIPAVFRAAGSSEEDYAGFLPVGVKAAIDARVRHAEEQRTMTRPPERPIRKGEYNRRKVGALPEAPSLPALSGPAIEADMAAELTRLVMGGEDCGPAAAPLDDRAAAWDAKMRAKSAGALLEKQG